ncbi:hypothetical protein IAU60_001949 [Kwoniella sp. DSM 27419]
MSQNIPATTRALVQNDQSWVSVKEIPTPKPGDNQVLIKVEYAAQNPTDWKHAAFISNEGVINGCDYAGTVVQVGSNLKTPLEVGDKIAGFVHGGNFQDQGSFAEYLKVESDLTFKVPSDLKPEEASTFGIPWFTAAQVLLQSQKHEFPPSKVSGEPWYVVYGGSSSVGLFAVNLAKTLGYKVLAFAGPHSVDLVKSYGATEVIDYHDQDKAVSEALRITGGGAEYGLDTISEGDSFKVSVRALGDKGKQLNAILPPPEDAHKINPDLKIVSTLVYTILGHEFNFSRKSGGAPIPYSADDHAFGKKIYAATPELITKYGIKPNPTHIRGGLDDITAGFEDMKAGKVSGRKLVYKIA